MLAELAEMKRCVDNGLLTQSEYAEQKVKLLEARLLGPATTATPAPATPHGVLGISTTASEAEIRAAYKSAVALHHPDKVVSAEAKVAAGVVFQNIQTAYESCMASSEPPVPVGSRVVIHGLMSATGTRYNGQQGQVQSFDSANKRHSVLLDAGSTTLALKPSNLTVLPNPSTASARSAMTNGTRAGAQVGTSFAARPPAPPAPVSARSMMTNSERAVRLQGGAGGGQLATLCRDLGAALPKGTAQSAVRSQALSKSYTAKLCFLVDVTGSMRHAIDGVRDILADILDGAAEAFPGISLEFGFVGYRDYGDSQQFEVFQFIGNAAELAALINNVRATGGTDEAEDVLGGMQTALTGLDWSGARFKVLVHIGDAPAHGKRFHDPDIGCKDDHQDKENCPRPSGDILGDFADLHVDYYFAQIESGVQRGRVTTNRMVKVFQEEYDQKQSKKRNFTIMDLRKFTTEGLFRNVLSGLTGSIRSRLGSRGGL
jgi:hypothetical protein